MHQSVAGSGAGRDRGAAIDGGGGCHAASGGMQARGGYASMTGMQRTGLTMALAAGLLAGCTAPPPASEGDFDSPNPAAKLYAIERAGSQRDRGKIPKLVEQLDNDDPAVRMMSIAALRRITGADLGYKPYEPPEARQAAIERWRAAVTAGRFE